MATLGPGFEWFVAWRHLRDPERRSRRALMLGLALLALGGLCLAVVYLGPPLPFLHRRGLGAGRAPLEWIRMRQLALFDGMKTAAIIAVAAGVVLTILGVLFASFTVFTAISIFGVFLGTGAPIVALSVMSGFEADLKTKIRATKADIVVAARDEGPFRGWQAVQERIGSVPGVLASMAYVESEVIIKHATNP